MDSTKPTILIIEDEPEMQELISEEIQKHGAQTQVTDNFADAIRRLNNQKYLAVVTDLHIKTGKGEDLIRRIRTDDKHLNAKTPFMVISGHLDVHVVQGLARLIDGALVKPFSFTKLGDWVQQKLADARALAAAISSSGKGH